MGAITKEIIRLKAENEKIKDDIVRFTRLKEYWTSGKGDMYEDYPNWRHPFHRTPMDWVTWKISERTNALEQNEKKLQKLYEERGWLEEEYYHPMDLIDILNAINSDGSIKCIKF